MLIVLLTEDALTPMFDGHMKFFKKNFLNFVIINFSSQHLNEQIEGFGPAKLIKFPTTRIRNIAAPLSTCPLISFLQTIYLSIIQDKPSFINQRSFTNPSVCLLCRSCLHFAFYLSFCLPYFAHHISS